jgi:carboxyl-terminal processing protease
MPRLYFGRWRGLVVLLGVAVGLTGLFVAPAPAIDQKQADQLTAQIVVTLLEHGHLSKPRVNDEVARKWARLFFKALDPQKLYFEKPDVEAFLAQDTTLDDQIRRGNFDFARAVFERYLQRHDERLATILELLQQKIDFTVDETIVDDPDLLDYPADARQARERWRKQIKYELLTKKILKVEEAEAVEQLKVRYRDLNRYFHQFDTTDLLERYLTGLTMAVDPHSSYMGSKSLEDLLGQQLHLSLEGIGASLSIEDGFPIVKEIVPGGAADKDGRLEPEDKIVGVEGEDGQVIDFVEKKLSDVVRIIRGPRGTKVKLIVQPADSKERKVYELVREKIELKDAHAKGQVIETKRADGRPLKVGVIDLPSFYGDTAAVRDGVPNAVSATLDCQRILEDFKRQGVDSVLIDLRRNGGGLLVEAITLSGLFIDTGPVVQVRDPEDTTHHDDDVPGTSWDGPLAVLISRYSASASEIFAGVIKDYGRGLIIGDSSTYGKGTVQSIVPLNERPRPIGGADLPDLGALKLTIQQFYRANGESTQVRGVRPDVHIPSFLDQADHLGEAKMDNALRFGQVPPLPHDQYNRVPADLVARVNQRSEARRRDNEKFQKQMESIQKLVDRKTRHAISLNEEKFRAEFVPDDDEDEEVKPKPKDRRKRLPEHLAWESNFYNDEVITIVADYVSLGAEALTAAPVRGGNVAASAR